MLPRAVPGCGLRALARGWRRSGVRWGACPYTTDSETPAAEAAKKEKPFGDIPGPGRLRSLYYLSLPFSDGEWDSLRQQFGDVVRLQGVFAKQVHLFHPDDFLQVLEAEGGTPHAPNATPLYEKFKDVYDLVEGLCEEHGSEWQRLHGAVAAKWNDSPEAQREQYAAVSAVLPEFFYLLESLITRNDSRVFAQRQLLRQTQVYVLEAMVAAMLGVRLGGLQPPNATAKFRRYHAVDDFEPRNYKQAVAFVDAVFIQSGSQKLYLNRHELSPHAKWGIFGDYCRHWGFLQRMTRSLVGFAQQRHCPHQRLLGGIGRRSFLLPASTSTHDLAHLQYADSPPGGPPTGGAGGDSGGGGGGGNGSPGGGTAGPQTTENEAPRPLEGLLGGQLIRHLLSEANVSLEETAGLCTEMLVAAVEKVGWTAYWLLTDLAILIHHQERCREEVFEVLGDRQFPTLEDLSQMQYLRACLLESQRRHQLQQQLRRQLDVDVVVGGFRVPAKTDLVLHISEAAMDHRFLDRPELFIPERWFSLPQDLEKGVNRKVGPKVSGAPASRFHPACFLPYGGGARECPGMEMAENLVLALAAGFVRRYQLQWPSPYQSDQSYAYDTGMYLMPHDVDFTRPIGVYRLTFKPKALLEQERAEMAKLAAEAQSRLPPNSTKPQPPPAVP